jgi:hypothetical protein
MTRPLHLLAFVLLVTLALCVGGPPCVFALERAPAIATATYDVPVQSSAPPQVLTDNGDPDDWATKSDRSEVGGNGAQSQHSIAGGSGTGWRDYMEYISELMIRTRLYLTGIL